MSWFQRSRSQKYSIVRRTRDEPPRPVDKAPTRGAAWRKVDRLNHKLPETDDTTWYQVLAPGETLPHTPSYLEMFKELENLHITLELQCLTDERLVSTVKVLRSADVDYKAARRRSRRSAK